MPQFESQFEENLYQLRRDKLAQIAALVRAQNPALHDADAKFPNSFAFTHTVPELRELGDPKSTEELMAPHIEAAIAGRIMAIRVQGKAGFAQIQQGGQRLQIYVRKDDVGEDLFAIYKLLDLGDHIGVRGYLMRTRTGELTLHAAPVGSQPAITFLTKAMLALPDKYHGLEDVELRYRQRYVDLIVNSGTLARAEAPTPGTSLVTDESADNEQHNDAPLNVREVFVKRAAILRAIRRFFDARGYLEVETPMLHTVAGGAAARPFATHHNALDIPLSLRIAPELYLKRLVVGGIDRVYEINRNFRNEGVSTRHNPEFTMLEFYQAYANYHALMDLTQELITQVAQDVNGTTTTHFNGNEIDLSKWTKLSMREAIIKFWPEDSGPKPTMRMFEDKDTFYDALNGSVKIRRERDFNSSPEALDAITEKEASLIDAVRGGGESEEYALAVVNLNRHTETLNFGSFIVRFLTDSSKPLGSYIAELFELLAEPHLIQPTIIYDFPLAVSPLAKVNPNEPDWVERFEFYIGGFEVGNAFSELNDPDDQRARFLAQVYDKDPESMAEVDEDYVRALGYGLPPTAGEGIGIDRLTMLLTGSRSIRDVILFPLMRPLKTAPQNEEQHGESAE